MINIIDNIFSILNNNNYFIGLMMILLNLGTRYLIQEFGILIDFIFNFKIIKRLMLFAVFFVATRNIKVSIILTGIIILFAFELLNERSGNCIIPNSLLSYMKKKKNTKEDIKNALEILKNNGFTVDKIIE